MKKEEIERIAQAIAAKLGEPGANQLLGCGDASSTQNYSCPGATYGCGSGGYECGGAGYFTCNVFVCAYGFECYTEFTCTGTFDCTSSYN